MKKKKSASFIEKQVYKQIEFCIENIDFKIVIYGSSSFNHHSGVSGIALKDFKF